MSAATATVGIVFGAIAFATGVYAYVGKSAPQYFRWMPGYGVQWLIPGGLGLICVVVGLLLFPNAAARILFLGGVGLLFVAIVATIWQPRPLQPWWLKDGEAHARRARSVLEPAVDAPERPPSSAQQAETLAYEERRRLTARQVGLVLVAATFTFLGVVGGLTGMPLWVATLTVLFFGGGGGIFTLLLVLNLRRIALRVDGEGVKLGLGWRRHPRLFLWARVRSVWLWTITYPLYLDYVGVNLSDDAPLTKVGLTQTAVPRGVVRSSIPISGWRFDMTAMLLAVQRFAGNVPVFRARPGEPPELLAGDPR